MGLILLRQLLPLHSICPILLLTEIFTACFQRYFGISTPIDSKKGKKEITEIANELMPQKNAGFHNQALMEFGALQCIPKSPDCNRCPVQANCYAAKHKKTAELPVKTKKTKQTHTLLLLLSI